MRHPRRILAGAALGMLCPLAAAATATSPPDAALIPMPGARAGIDPVPYIQQGRVTILSIDQYPPAMREALEQERDIDRRGFEAVDATHWDWDDANGRPDLLAPDEARARLRFTPATFAGGANAAAANLHAEGLLLPGPRSMPGPWGSATHVLRRNDGVPVYLQEVAYAESGGAIMLTRELLNAKVGDAPARFKLQRAPGGRAMSMLVWVTPRRYFALSVRDDVTAPGNAYDRDWMRRLAESVQEH